MTKVPSSSPFLGAAKKAPAGRAPAPHYTYNAATDTFTQQDPSSQARGQSLVRRFVGALDAFLAPDDKKNR